MSDLERIRAFVKGVLSEADDEIVRCGVTGAHVEAAKAAVARDLLALLDSLPAPASPVADDLGGLLGRYVAGWVVRSALRIRDEMCVAKLEIRLLMPQGEDDGTLYLDYTIDETITADSAGGRVTGLRFDPQPEPRS